MSIPIPTLGWIDIIGKLKITLHNSSHDMTKNIQPNENYRRYTDAYYGFEITPRIKAFWPQSKSNQISVFRQFSVWPLDSIDKFNFAAYDWQSAPSSSAGKN